MSKDQNRDTNFNQNNDANPIWGLLVSLMPKTTNEAYSLTKNGIIQGLVGTQSMVNCEKDPALLNTINQAQTHLIRAMCLLLEAFPDPIKSGCDQNNNSNQSESEGE